MAVRASVYAVTCALVVLGLGGVNGKYNWGYDEDNGPDKWGDDEDYKDCNGKAQSPINIPAKSLEKISDKNRPRFKGFDTEPTDVTIKNEHGHTALVSFGNKDKYILKKNGVTYEFLQMHFHWGKSEDKGSEHQIDGQSYSGEMHMVFKKKDKMDIVVLGTFLKEKSGTENNDQLTPITDVLPKIKNTDDESDVKNMPALAKLLPKDKFSYFTYQGSLTTPPCSEVVTWMVFPDPLTVSTKQMDAFRQLKKRRAKITKNFRPVQDLNGRNVTFVGRV